MEAAEKSFSLEKEKNVGKRTYNIEGTNISVSFKTFAPKENVGTDPTKAVIFIPGWSIPHNAHSLTPMEQEFADYSKNNTLVVDTTTEKIGAGNLTQEAKALVKFIEERKLKNITLVGNSQGGAEAIHLIALLQETHPEIAVDGLALFDPVSLTNQSRRKLFANYVADVAKTQLAQLRRTHISNGSDVRMQNLKYDLDGITGILKSVVQAKGIGWPVKVWNEISEMVQKNPDLAKVNVPVVLIQGAGDKISDPSTTIPDNNDGYIADQKKREEYLRSTIFPNSPYIRVIIPEKMGYHNVSYSRPESVAKTTLYLLERFNRSKTK